MDQRPPQAGRGAQPRWVGQHGPRRGQAGSCSPQHGAHAAGEGHGHRGAEGLPGAVQMGLCPFWLPTWPRRSWGGAPAGMEVGGSLSLHLWGSSGTPRSGDPALRPAHRTHLYCAAYERPRPVPAAKGKLLQVGGESCLLGSPGARLARGHMLQAGPRPTLGAQPFLCLRGVVEPTRDREGGGVCASWTPAALGASATQIWISCPLPLQDFFSQNPHIPTFFLTSQAYNPT